MVTNVNKSYWWIDSTDSDPRGGFSRDGFTLKFYAPASQLQQTRRLENEQISQTVTRDCFSSSGAKK